jgi:hypothetical protein
MTHLHPDDRVAREPGGPIRGPEPAYVPEHAAPLDVLTDELVQRVLTELRRHLVEDVIVELQLREHLVYREHLDWWQRLQWALVGAFVSLLLMLAMQFGVWGVT